MLKLEKTMSNDWELTSQVGRLLANVGIFKKNIMEGFCRWLEGDWKQYTQSNVVDFLGSVIGVGVDQGKDQKLYLTFSTESLEVRLGPIFDYSLKDYAMKLRKEMKEDGKGKQAKKSDRAKVRPADSSGTTS